VDLVVGESYGGRIAQYLAARYPDRVTHTAVVAAAAEVSARGKEVDSRMAQGVADGDPTAAGGAMLEYLLPRDRLGRIRRLLGPAVGDPIIARYRKVPRDDLLTEARAEVAFDSRVILPRIRDADPADLWRPRPVLHPRGGRGDGRPYTQLLPDLVRREGPHENRGQRARGFGRPGVRRTSLAAYQSQWLLGVTVIRSWGLG
jgi:pimeloyl-ACP methyl ester carboxylesterase